MREPVEDKDQTKEQLIKDLAQTPHQDAKVDIYMSAAPDSWLKAFANNLTNGLYIVQDGKFIFTNDMFRKYVGYSEEELYGMDSLSLVYSEDRDMVRENAAKMLKRERSSPYEFRYVNKSGEAIYVMETVTPIWYQGKKATMGSFMDITERRTTQETLRQSEERLLMILEKSADGIVILGDGLVKFINAKGLEMIDFSLEGVLGKPFIDYISPHYRNQVMERYERRIAGAKVLEIYEMELLRKDGSILPVEIHASLIEYDGKPATLSMARDITERKRVEKDLAETSRRLHSVVSAAPIALWELDSSGNIVTSEGNALNYLGTKPGERVGKSVFEVYKNDVAALENIRRGLAGEKFRAETRVGDRVWMNDYTPRLSDGKEVIGLIGVSVDITQIKTAEEELLLKSNLLDIESDCVYLYDLEGNFIYINKMTCILHGYTKEELLNINISQLHLPESAQQVNQRRKEILEKGRISFETSHLHRNGSRVPLEIHAQMIEVNGRKLVMSVARDITERKQTEKSLAESEQRYRTLFEKAVEGILIVDIETREFRYANPSFCRLLGYTAEELSRMRVEDIHPEEVREHVNSRFESQSRGEMIQIQGDLPYLKKDGTIIYMYVSAAKATIDGRVCGIGFFTDITERKYMEEERQKSARLESIGTLAGGIAHDFNNILTSILGNIQLADRFVKQGRADTAEESLAEAEKASLRARDLTQQLLTFSRGGAPVKGLMHIDKLLKESAIFALRGSSCRPEFAIAQDLWAVEADEGQLNQVIHNLIINAGHAMPNGGIINISAGNLLVGKQQTLPLPEGKYIEIVVEDHGIGIPKGNKKRIFEPYFTTKGKGSGLGLATAYSIIKNHGGIITFESTLGVGTTFHIYLSATVERCEETESNRVSVEEKLPAAQARILVMDDEETIRKLLGRMLQSAGYEVELTSEGAETVKKYTEAREAGKPYDVVILDLTIPGGMGGREVIIKLLEIDPGIKAIVSSGYASDPIMAEYKEYGFSGVVTKPYNLAQMQETIRNILSQTVRQPCVNQRKGGLP